MRPLAHPPGTPEREAKAQEALAQTLADEVFNMHRPELLAGMSWAKRLRLRIGAVLYYRCVGIGLVGCCA